MIFFWLGIRWILLTSGIISGPLKLLFFLFIVDWCSISFIIRSFFNTVIRGIIEFFFLILEYRILIRSFIINIRFGRFPRLVMICLIFLLRDLLRFISVSIISSLWRCLSSRFVCIVTFLRFLLRLVYISLFIQRLLLFRFVSISIYWGIIIIVWSTYYIRLRLRLLFCSLNSIDLLLVFWLLFRLLMILNSIIGFTLFLL